MDFRQDFRPRDTLVLNPPGDNPVGLTEQIICQALAVARHAVCVIEAIPRLAGEERYWDLYKPCPPALILICAKRPSMPPGGIGAKEAGGTVDYQWSIWSRERPQLLRRNGPPAPNGWWHSPDGTMTVWLEPTKPLAYRRKHIQLAPRGFLSVVEQPRLILKRPTA